MSGPIYLFAGGGTGGHLYPGLAVAEQVSRMNEDARVVFVCSGRVLDRRILDLTEYAVVAQPVRPLPRSLRGWSKFTGSWHASSLLVRDLIRDLRPAAVLGLGGFAAVPAVRRAARDRIRTAILNPDSVPGISNRYLAKYTFAIFTQFDSTSQRFKRRFAEKVRSVGCPIRSAMLGASRAEAIEYFHLRAGLSTLLVLGGSSGAESINETVGQLGRGLDSVSAGWQMIHITGADPVERTEATAPQKMEVCRLEYCDRMDLAYAAADIVLGRAGAVTVAEISATATPAVLMPYPHHRDDHQRLNAAELAAAGAAVIVEDVSDARSNARRAGDVIFPLLKHSATLEQMSQAASRLARPDAAKKVAAWLCR